MKRAYANDIHALPTAEPPEWIDGARLGRIASMDAEGHFLVDYPGNPYGPLPAMMCASIAEKLGNGTEDMQPRVVLLFENNDPRKPIVVDMVVDRVEPPVHDEILEIDVGPDQDCTIDGRTIQFNADHQIVLKCGKASITLTRAGKVLIRGTHLVNRSSGVNRIRGASVHVN